MDQEQMLSEALTTLQYFTQLLSLGTNLDIEATLPNGEEFKLHFETKAGEPAKKMVRRRRAKAAAAEPAE